MTVRIGEVVFIAVTAVFTSVTGATAVYTVGMDNNCSIVVTSCRNEYGLATHFLPTIFAVAYQVVITIVYAVSRDLVLDIGPTNNVTNRIGEVIFIVVTAVNTGVRGVTTVYTIRIYNVGLKSVTVV